MPVGWFGGHRTVKEQLLGLEHALALCNGKTVLDAGCAEGAISLEFVKAGAKHVTAFDNQITMVERAQQHQSEKLTVLKADINDATFELHDIVLALAVLHKASNIPDATQRLVDACKELMVIRLPKDSTGWFSAKHWPSEINLNSAMPAHGFMLMLQVPGPRSELVQYWRRA